MTRDAKELAKDLRAFRQDAFTKESTMLSRMTDRDKLMEEAADLLEHECDRSTSSHQRWCELVASAAPLTWVANGDMDGAAEWEKRASALLEELRGVEAIRRASKSDD